MKAVVLEAYGGVDKLKYQDWDEPVAGEDEVLVHVAAASINPVDWKIRSGEAQGRFPMELPGILGRDVAGTVRAVGARVSGFEPGDRVFAVAWKTYAEFCVVQAGDLAKVPEGMDLVECAALPLVTITGEQLIRLGTEIQAGQTVVITGALGSVGRAAVWTAKQRGAKVIAAVRKSQRKEAEELKADEVIALDDDASLAKLGQVHAVADTIGGKVAEALLPKIVAGGVYASVVGPAAHADLHPTVRMAMVMAKPDPERMVEAALAVKAGALTIPIDRMIALSEAAEGQAAAEKGGIGKVLLMASGSELSSL